MTNEKPVILLVEDDALFRSAIKTSILKKNVRIDEAADGESAKEKMLKSKYDLVISDIQMPRFTGLDLLTWIKDQQPTPVVLMTGFSYILETQQAAELGAVGFLAKPFKEAEILEVLDKVLKLDAPVSEQTKQSGDLDLDAHFQQVSIDSFMEQDTLFFDLFVRITNSRYVKIATAGGPISKHQLKDYRKRGISHVYVRKE